MLFVEEYDKSNLAQKAGEGVNAMTKSWFGQPAPSFGFRILATGERSSLRAFEGKPTVIHFYDGG